MGCVNLGPLFLAASFALSSYALSASKGVVGELPGGVRFLLNLFEFTLLAGALTALYKYVPNSRVQFGHALAGGIFVAGAVEVAKKVLAYYIGAVPTYAAVYGAFATVPILLIWIYVVWVIILLGAVIAAYLPSLLTGVARRGDTPGLQFTLAVEVLQQLKMNAENSTGVNTESLAKSLRVNPLQLETVLETLQSLGWVGQLDEAQERFVLLANPSTTLVKPLVDQLLLSPSQATEFIERVGLNPSASLGSVLEK